MTSSVLENFVKDAAEDLRMSPGDKHYCNPDMMLRMLHDGAMVRALNILQSTHGFVHTVWYKGITFVGASDKIVLAFGPYEKKPTSK